MANASCNPTMEIQSYLNLFRVAELKELMRSMNISTTGRKRDLQVRAEQLVITGSPKVHKRIREIYEKHFGDRRFLRSPPKPPMSLSTSHAPPTYQVKHPDIKLKPHPFYQHIDSLVRPTFLSQTPSSYHGDKAMVVQFHLTPQQVQQIYMSETTRGNYQTQVILRLCRRETSCEQEDFCPMKCYLTINKQSCPIPGYNPLFSIKPDYKRHIKPINITSYVHTSAALVNTVTITWQDDIIYPQGFCVSIDLMRALSSSDLLQTLKGRGLKSPEISRALVKEKLIVEKDSEIAATSLRLSLICPLGKMRMIHPCRSISCNHLQCFDAGTYLQMNEKKGKWVCPVCDKPAPFSDLIIDGLLMEICSRSDETDIEFSTDGSWHPIKSKSKITYSLTSSFSLSPTTVTISDSPASGSNNGGPNQSSGPIVIDLTLDSDDDSPIVETASKTERDLESQQPVSPSMLWPHSYTDSYPESHSGSSSFLTLPAAQSLTYSCTDAITRSSVNNEITRVPVISDTRSSQQPKKINYHKRLLPPTVNSSPLSARTQLGKGLSPVVFSLNNSTYSGLTKTMILPTIETLCDSDNEYDDSTGLNIYSPVSTPESCFSSCSNSS